MNKLTMIKKGKLYILDGLCRNKMYIRIALTKKEWLEIKKTINTKIK